MLFFIDDDDYLPSIARIKVFQSDGGNKFTSTCFKAHLLTSGIHHQLSWPYTPSQNYCAERKYRHVTETSLTLLFYSHLSSRVWVDAFSTTTYIINWLLTSVLGRKSPLNLSKARLCIMIIFIPLVVVFILAYVIICLTNFLPVTFFAF